MRKILEYTVSKINEGKQLSEGLAQYDRAFPSLVIQVIRIGEQSGTLQTSCRYIVSELEKSQKLRGKIITALLYPFIVVLATFGILCTIMFYVFPKIIPIFKSLRIPLPLTTRALLEVNRLISEHYIIFAAVPIISIALLVLLTRVKRFKNITSVLLLKIPLIGNLLRYHILAHITHTLGHLINNHVPLIQAISITRTNTTNAQYKNQLGQMENLLKQGRNIAYSFGKYPKLYPHIMVQMTAAGEQTGTLSQSLLYTAQLYEQEISEQMDRITVLLEPLLMVIIGLLVAAIAMSIITPLYGITQHIQP